MESFSNCKVRHSMLNQVKAGGVGVCSNSQHCLRSHHSNITCIYKTSRVSKGSINMHRVFTWLRLSSFAMRTSLIDSESIRGTHAYNISRTVSHHPSCTFLGNSCAPTINGLHQAHSAKDRSTAVNWLLSYSDTNMCPTPAPRTDHRHHLPPHALNNIDAKILNGP